MRGYIRYSIKYDLGGYISDFDKFLKKANKRFSPRSEPMDLKLFNFSFLSRAPRTVRLAPYTMAVLGEKWTVSPFVEERGIITLEVETSRVDGANPNELVNMLLDLHGVFLDDKNIDYINYLEDRGQLRGRLAELELPNEQGMIDFSTFIADLRRVAEPYLEGRGIYEFHDFRPIFIIENSDGFTIDLIRKLCNLSLNDQFFENETSTTHATTSVFGRSGPLWGNSWAYVIVEQDITPEFSGLFYYAHTAWYLSQSAIFELRDLDEEIITKFSLSKKSSQSDLQLFIDRLQIRKNRIFLELLTVLNSDFITKNSSLRDRFAFLREQFGIDTQIGILERYIDRVTDFLTDYSRKVDQENSRRVARNTKVLEFLFLINTIAGIGSFAPTFFSSGVNDMLVLDLPRMLSLIMIVTSLVFYLIFVLAGGILSRWKGR